MFGIELRKRGDTTKLYQDVDSVLAKSGATYAGSVGVSTKVSAVAHALQVMFQVDKYFDICTIRHCANLCQINISSERLSLYATQHCISWSNMDNEFRQELVAMVLDDFRAVLTIEDK